ncbi:MAG TPA: MBL fold metallo-hydrolase, partial [Tepidisphaeraceae bacterium]|nr:MBL fold metallo-hydrolase [Tepidisphaeraceae bacterium]
MELCVLASGSGGNSSLLRTPSGCVLIDAGIGPRTAAKRMAGTGCEVADVRGIVLTHLDRDHFSPTWVATILRQKILVFVHRRRRGELLEICGEVEELVRPFGHQRFEPLPEVGFLPMELAHDDAGSHGFVICGFGCRIGYATDLGRVPGYLVEAFEDLNILALEANYDPEMQLASGRPMFLKKRIMGGKGHLSNGQALAAIREILDRAERRGLGMPSEIVLLH